MSVSVEENQADSAADLTVACSNELTQAEQERCREFFTSFGFKTSLSVITYPLTFAKTLFQIGYEPYALSAGKVYIIMGRDAYFLPNAFTYLRQIARDFGAKALYAGIDAAIFSNVVNGTVSFTVSMYLDHFFPDIGGAPENVGKAESELTHHQSARVKIREVIRSSIAHTVGIIASRPFTTIMIREIAQLVGGETKYPNLLKSLVRVGHEEGLPGFFAGLVPCLLVEYITLWGITSIRYGTERILQHMQKDEKDEELKKTSTDICKVLDYLIPLAVNSFSYPLQVVSTIMAVGGSGLAVSLLPYSPMFMHWENAYNYLKPYGLTRGARLFLREQKGAISIGQDRRLYASNKHFI